MDSPDTKHGEEFGHLLASSLSLENSFLFMSLIIRESLGGPGMEPFRGQLHPGPMIERRKDESCQD